MSRITTPTVEQSPVASQPWLDAVNKKFGIVPNLMRVLGNSPAALGGFLSLNGELAKGTLGAKNGARIALAISEYNSCEYCLSAHTYLGRNLAKLDDAEMVANRDGRSSDPKAEAAVEFAVKVARQRGRIDDSDLQAVRRAGFTEGEVMEIVAHVALTVLTNYVNLVAQTEIDFPAVEMRKAA